MNPEIIYRDNGQMVLAHAAREDGSFMCGKPRDPVDKPITQRIPACPECLELTVEYVANHAL